jgi:hypothetical protein
LVYKEVLSIFNRDFQQFFEVFVSFILITLIPPLSDEFSVEDENVEGVEESGVVFDGHSRSMGIGVSKVYDIRVG